MEERGTEGVGLLFTQVFMCVHAFVRAHACAFVKFLGQAICRCKPHSGPQEREIVLNQCLDSDGTRIRYNSRMLSIFSAAVQGHTPRAANQLTATILAAFGQLFKLQLDLFKFCT